MQMQKRSRPEHILTTLKVKYLPQRLELGQKLNETKWKAGFSVSIIYKILKPCSHFELRPIYTEPHREERKHFGVKDLISLIWNNMSALSGIAKCFFIMNISRKLCYTWRLDTSFRVLQVWYGIATLYFTKVCQLLPWLLVLLPQ